MNSRLVLLLVIAFYTIAIAAQDQPKFVGKQACWSCHTPEQEAVAGTPHETGKSCEACHGPGSEHIRSTRDQKKIFSFTRASSAEVREKCGQCHSNPVMTRHAAGDVSCLDCHSSHHYLNKRYLLKGTDEPSQRSAQVRGSPSRLGAGR